jgi:flagellar basal-body rod protein FlgG
MSAEISSTLAGALTQEMRLNVLANNIANVNTAGFKEDRIFQLPQTSDSVWNNTPAAARQNTALDNVSSLPVSTFTNFEQGPLKETGNSLDMALEGDGFFAIQTPGGIRYTRKGSFSLSQNGVLVTQEGYPVLGKNKGEIRINGQNVSVDSSGAVFVDNASVDSLDIVGFSNRNNLEKVGDSLYSAQDPNDQGAPATTTQVQQGFIESSNVDSIKAMTDMIDVLRGYESYQKIIQSMNDTTSKTVNDVGKMP